MARFNGVLALLLLLLNAGLSAAQQIQPASGVPAGAPAAPAGYAQATVLLTVAPDGTPSHRVFPPLGGSAAGVSFAVGRFVTRAWAIEGEIVLAGTMSRPQQFSYTWSEHYIGDSRDHVVGGNVRWRPNGAPYLEVLGGGGVAFSRVRQLSVVRTDLVPTKRTSLLPDETSSDLQPTLSAGADARFPLGRRIDIGPSFRMRWIRRPEPGLAAYAGVNSYAYQMGAWLRFKW